MSTQTTVMAHQHPASKRFHEILMELGALHDQKQADYGREHDPFANVRASEEWGVAGWVGALVRATDKLRRLQKVAQGGTLANEGVEDSLRDLAVYAVIALVLWEQQGGRVGSGASINVSLRGTVSPTAASWGATGGAA